MPGIADTDANALVSAEVRATSYAGPASLWLSLHTGDPGKTGAYEAVGGGYARVQVTFAAPVAGASQNTAMVAFTGLPAGTYTHVGLWDAVTGGNFRQSGALGTYPPGTTVQAGAVLPFAAGSIVYSAVGA